MLNVVGVDRALDTVIGVVTVTGSAGVSASFDGKSDKVNFKISDNATKCRSGTHQKASAYVAVSVLAVVWQPQ